ncbi:MAG TPA: hypothetical protein VFB38_08560 [Chthonomonadaceae bacterium]|nr:hypothetical protein [Chthonomonadaceae bacterium]
MKKVSCRGAVILLAACLVSVPVAGCHREDDGLSPKQRQTVDRLDEIAKKSGGDWDKVSQADRDYLVNEVAHGSEQSAKMMLMAKGGKMHANPGGPPNR